MNKNKLIKGINNYLFNYAKRGNIFGGVKFISSNKKDEYFIFEFEGKKYEVYFFEKMDRFPQKSFIRVFDFSREKPSLVQYTIDTSNFLVSNNNFELIQNRGTTIGRRVIGFETEFKNLMHKNGFNKNDIITSGPINNLKYDKILNDVFSWLRIRIKSKLSLELKYRDIENEVDVEILDIITKTEGGKKVVISTRAERDGSLKKKAIQLHGTVCMACNFDFKLTYGSWAENYIEVHHMQPLRDLKGKKTETNPKTDLTVVCANCHRMIHKKRDITLTIEELKKKIKMK